MTDPEPPGDEPGPATPPPSAGRLAALRHEAQRKAIHVAASCVAAAVVWRLPHLAATTVLSAATLLALGVELARVLSATTNRAFDRLLAPLLRPAEKRRLTGATLLAIGFTLAAALFPRPAAVAGILFAGLGDAAAAVVGRAAGRHRYPWGKSVEGSIAFLLVALGVALGVGLAPLPALATALVATLVEAAPLPLDDNLLLPVAGAAAVAIASGLAPSRDTVSGYLSRDAAAIAWGTGATTRESRGGAASTTAAAVTSPRPHAFGLHSRAWWWSGSEPGVRVDSRWSSSP